MGDKVLKLGCPVEQNIEGLKGIELNESTFLTQSGDEPVTNRGKKSPHDERIKSNQISE